ncbi:hypothetical protein TrRE_jg3813 [Triparma retinervis]|uniref:GST N-terminal domain-containing protein n=1 Tax=Triparma retinervis TaxID=2557542 RepID=A0A9W7A540_9STRA|nr:hypothetical protein TrRE_jg3813 [Triparma retinervis]
MKTSSFTTAPTLHYFSICGRGELARLVAAAGDLPIIDKTFDPPFDETGNWRQGYQEIGKNLGLPGTLPVLEHDDGFACFQSNAIESYLSNIAPRFKDLTPSQRAKDLQFALIKADVLAQAESLLFKKITAGELAPVMARYYLTIEELLPSTGFINGLDFPTMADLSIVVVAKGCMPFQAASTLAGVAFDPLFYPKMERVASAAMAYPAVAEYLANSEHKTLTNDPFDIMKK